MAALWVETDEHGKILRAAPEVHALFASLDPPESSLERVVNARVDVAAAVRRRAGFVRIGLGHGRGRCVFDALITEGARGAHWVLEQVDPLSGVAELGRVLVAHAEHHPDGFAVSDPDGVILWCDLGFCELVRYSREEVAGRFFATFRSPHTPAAVVDAYTRGLRAGDCWTGEMTLRRSDGMDIPAHHSVTLIRDGQGRVTHHVAVVHGLIRDREIERLRAIDQSVTLVSRVMVTFANDLNNLAGEITGETERAMLSDDPASAGEALARVHGVGASLGELGRRMLAFAATGSPTGPADLGQVAQDLGRLLHVASGGRGVVEVRVPEETVMVACAPDALIRASIHLALRALDGGGPDAPVMVSGELEAGFGVLRVRYLPTAAEREALRWLVPDGLAAGPEVNALVARAYGQGVELRLAEDIDGLVAIEVYAALAGEPAAEPDTGEATVEARWGRLVVVEDNAPLRALMVSALEGMFDEVVEVENSEDALAAAERYSGAVDLLLVDVQLPGGSGLDLLVDVLDRWPGMRAVIASGTAGEGLVRSARAAGARAVLRKPFRLNELRAVVRSVLAGAEW